jgi:spermidine synthase
MSKIIGIIEKRKIINIIDTPYGQCIIKNSKDKKGNKIRMLVINETPQSSCFIDENKKYELVSEYLKKYDLMFKNNEVNSTLMFGGAGFSYPKHYINCYPDKSIDVIEINPDMLDIAKTHFYLNDLLIDRDCSKLNIIIENARHYIKRVDKKYDAILNDTFFGIIPEKSLTTIEALSEVKKLLNNKGQYLVNIISSIEGGSSNFLKSEMNTISKVFKHVYAIPCNPMYPKKIQNIMVIASDFELQLENIVDIEYVHREIITDENNITESIAVTIY